MIKSEPYLTDGHPVLAVLATSKEILAVFFRPSVPRRVQAEAAHVFSRGLCKSPGHVAPARFCAVPERITATKLIAK